MAFSQGLRDGDRSIKPLVTRGCCATHPYVGSFVDLSAACKDACRNMGSRDEVLTQRMLGRGTVRPVALSMSAARLTPTVSGRTSLIAFVTVASLAP
jgi:hypothetical protein